MVKRSGFVIGVSAMVSSLAGAAAAAPSYCPTGSSVACGGREVGDILIANQSTGRIVGLNPNTGALYFFSTELPYNELGDIAVVPSNPLTVVAIGNVDGGIGIRQLDSCGHLGTLYGPYPEVFSPPIPPYSKGGMVGRGAVFNPLSGKLYAPDRSTRLLDDSGPYNILFSFPQTGGPFSLELAYAPLAEQLNPDSQGLLAADEMGSLYFGNGNRIAKIPTGGLQAGFPEVVEYSISGDTLVTTTDVVHDGNHHLFISGSSGGQGVVWRLDTLTGVSELWATDRGPTYAYEPYNQLQGITLDANGDILAVEKYSSSTLQAAVVRISKDNGNLIQYFPIPASFGPGVADGLKTIAVLGVNLPAVREACSSDCDQGFVTDCYGACMPAVHVGDGFCDEGPHSNLTCFSRGYDERDCNSCPADQVPDCHGHCAPLGWVGDDICDDGGWWFDGQAISFDCEEFRFDEATCRGCGWGEMLDCNGNCSPRAWFADGVCDDGGWSHLGHPVVYRCVEYDFDGNDCPVGG